MWSKINLRIRVYTTLSLLVLITLLGGVVMVWYTYQMQGLMNQVIDKNLTAFEAAVDLETDLSTQKGFVSYYFIDGNPAWLKMLAKHRLTFKAQVEKALSLAETKEQNRRPWTRPHCCCGTALNPAMGHLLLKGQGSFLKCGLIRSN